MRIDEKILTYNELQELNINSKVKVELLNMDKFHELPKVFDAYKCPDADGWFMFTTEAGWNDGITYESYGKSWIAYKLVEKPLPVVINLYGSPGTGKSTMAAYVFSQLKLAGVNAELVTEYAKDKTWEHNTTALTNQIYVFAKQYYRLSRCEDQVDVIVTDSPILLSLLYTKDVYIKDELKQLILKVYDRYNNLNYFLQRVKPYNPKGRNQTEEESNVLALKTRQLLQDIPITYQMISGDKSGSEKVLEDVKQLLIDLGVMRGE